MKICVTGGFGFIGKELVNNLNRIGYKDIIIVDDSTKGTYNKFVDYNVILKDNEDLFIFKDESFSFLDGVDFVFHLGANSSTRATASEVYRQNILFSNNLIMQCTLRGIYVVFASSGAVYGSSRKEFAFPKPLTYYGQSKLITEKFVRYFPNENVVCLRYHNVFGATEKHKGNMASIVSKWINDHKEGKREFLLFEDSENIERDFIHVDDINKANITFLDYWIANKKFPEIKVFDIGTGRAVSFQKLANEILRLTKVEFSYVPNPYDKTNYQFHTKADIYDFKKVYFETYGKPFTTMFVREGIKKVFDALNIVSLKNKKKKNGKK